MGQKLPPVQINMNDVAGIPRWYTVVTKFNYEQKFATDLQKGIENKGITNIQEIFVPIYTEKIEKIDKDGKIKISEKYHKIYPSYVFVKCIMNEDIWAFIRRTSGCSTILATGATPCTMSDADIQKIKCDCGIKQTFNVGDKVEIINHVFAGNCGIIIETNHINNMIVIKLHNELTVKISGDNAIRR